MGFTLSFDAYRVVLLCFHSPCALCCVAVSFPRECRAFCFRVLHAACSTVRQRRRVVFCRVRASSSFVARHIAAVSLLVRLHAVPVLSLLLLRLYSLLLVFPVVCDEDLLRRTAMMDQPMLSGPCFDLIQRALGDVFVSLQIFLPSLWLLHCPLISARRPYGAHTLPLYATPGYRRALLSVPILKRTALS